MNRYQLSRLSRGKARSLAPIISGTRKLPKRVGDRRDQEEPHHDDAVHGEETVVGVGADQIGLGRRELNPDRRRRGAADEEEEYQACEIENCDALVIRREKPRSKV